MNAGSPESRADLVGLRPVFPQGLGAGLTALALSLPETQTKFLEASTRIFLLGSAVQIREQAVVV